MWLRAVLLVFRWRGARKMSTMLKALVFCAQPQNLFVNLLCGFPVGMIYLWFVQAICPPKSAHLFWTVNSTYLFLLVFFKPLYAPSIRILLGMGASLVFPVLTMRGSLLRRTIVCALCMLLQFACELLALLVWVSLTGMSAMDNYVALAYAPQFIFAMVVGYLVVLPMLLTGLKHLCDRFFPLEPILGRAVAETPLWQRRFMLFPLLQLVLLLVLFSITFDMTHGSMEYAIVTLILLALCVVADFALVVQMGRSLRKRQADLEALLLEERVSSYLQDTEEVQIMMADAAKLRHDLHNHLSVIELLTQRGEYQEARAYIEQVREQLRQKEE